MKQLIRRTRHPVAAGTLIAAVLIASPFAVAATGDVLREGVRNGTATKETEIIGNMRAQAGKGGFVTRQSNISTGANAGGGAIYGCRTPVGGTAAGTHPCLRASNLAGGSAFEFATSGGPTAGLISIGNPAVANPGAPFTTNAVGVATGLNADNVDGKSAAQIIAEARAKPGLDADTLDGKDSTAFVLGADVAGLIPVAVVNIAADGTLRSSSHRAPVTGTPIVSHVAASAFYDVDLPGVKFFFSDDAANCTIADGDSKIATVNSINGDDLRVRVRTDAGVDTEGALYCSIYNLK